MKFPKIYYGTQYYRSPTPLSDEWEQDISRFESYGLDAFQIRINWRANERQEGVYTFEDVDALMDLAEKYNRKVVIKFLLECAPQYIYDKYHGYRIGPKGEVLRGGSHGAFYAGGWLPCFTNPKVRERAARFVEVVTKRYHNRSHLILWSAWNEPRNKPIEECFCPECRKKYGEHLQKKYGTIENLNRFYGVYEDSFDTIALPAMPHGYWDIYEFKKFKSGDGIYENLRFVYDAIRRYDKKRPIISHSGFCSAYQSSLSDCLDDDAVSKAVDLWGTSIPCDTRMDTLGRRLDYQLLNDYLGSVNPDYFVYEVYPGLGMYRYAYDNDWDMSYKLFTAIAAGAKGIQFWQFRAERVGHENDCAGLMRMDGSPRPVSESVKKFGDFLAPLSSEIAACHKSGAQIAILFDYDSSLLSEIEDSCGRDYCFDNCFNVEAYRRAHFGFYKLMRSHDYQVDYLQSSKIQDVHRYKVLYVPYYVMIKPEVVSELERFVSEGGILLADEGFGLRDPNTWINPYDLKVGKLFSGRVLERRLGDIGVKYQDVSFVSKGYHSEIRVANAKVWSTFEDGVPAVQATKLGKGCTYLFGFSFGYDADSIEPDILMRLFDDITQQASLHKEPYSDVANGLEVRTLAQQGERLVFLANCNAKQKEIVLTEPTECLYGGLMKGNKLVIEPHSIAVLRSK